MPGPKDALKFLIEEEVEPSGEVTRTARPELGGPDVDLEDERELPDLLVHRTLSGSRPAGDEMLIVANEPITIPSPGLFDKFRVLLRDTARVAYVAVDRDVNSNFGGYDDIVPGGFELEEYCRPGSFLSVMVDGVPATPVEVHLYAGRYARPK